jgi:hypothetical protein
LSKNLETNPNILGARSVTWTQFHTKDPQLSGAAVQNLVARDLFSPDISFYNIKMAV